MNRVISRLLRLQRTHKGLYTLHPDISVGLEMQTDPKEYHWDGIVRGGNPSHPVAIFQYTLRGWGHFTEGGMTHKVTAGRAFLAIIPSRHAYYLPAESPEWTFFWIMLRHPYVSARLAETRGRSTPILPLDADDALLAVAAKLFEGVGLGTFRDDFAREMALFEFLIEYGRFVHQAAYPKSAERERLLGEARARVLSNLSRAVGVTELAEGRGMSRSLFAHHFKSTTGVSPARFITDVRLQEVSRRLVGSHDTLKLIAAQTGFADANHLCKVFRRNYHVSPGAFRRQLR